MCACTATMRGVAAGVAQQHGGAAGVLAGHHVGLAQARGGPGAQILEVPDRGPHHHQAFRTGHGGPPRPRRSSPRVTLPLPADAPDDQALPALPRPRRRGPRTRRTRRAARPHRARVGRRVTPRRPAGSRPPPRRRPAPRAPGARSSASSAGRCAARAGAGTPCAASAPAAGSARIAAGAPARRSSCGARLRLHGPQRRRGRVERQDHPSARAALDKPPGGLLGTPTNTLILGVDARKGKTRSRADTILIMRTDPDSGRIKYLSIPRDWRVELPGWAPRRSTRRSSSTARPG